jgi:hypothetical protein
LWNIRRTEVAALIALIIVLFLSPYEKAAYQVNSDFDVTYRIAKLCRSHSQP